MIATNTDAAVETQNLTKIYKDFWGRDKVRALTGLDVTIHRGEVFGLLGPNGSGKSTTIKLLLGLIFPTRGTAAVLCRAAGDTEVNEKIGFLLDEPTTGLDPIGTREMKDLILSLKAQGKTVLLCSHLLADVQDVCDRITILFGGRMRELGHVRDLLQVKDITQVQARQLTETQIA